MIPDYRTITALWETYTLPKEKRIHCQLVCDVASFIARALEQKKIPVDKTVVERAALLHDIDKCMEKLPGDRHPDAGVRMLKKEGYEEIADIVRTHPLHTILDPQACPITIEQKIVYLADKLVKYEFIGLDQRFSLWRHEDVDEASQVVLREAYPKVCTLRDELLGEAGLTEEAIRLALQEKSEHNG